MSEKMMSLYDYLGKAAGSELGKNVALYAKAKKTKSETRFVSNPKYTGETVIKGEYLFLVANATYQSRYTAQSWTNDFAVAMSFANSDLDIPVIMEIELTRENTLFSPESSVTLSGFGEAEIIRVGNRPTKVKVYVNIQFMIEFFCYRILSNGGTKGVPKAEQTSWWTKQFEGLFSQLGDEKFVKDLMANPKIKAIIKREAKVSI